MSSKVREVVRARIRDRIRARQYLEAEPGLGSVTIVPQKTKAELQDELDAAGIEYSKSARKAELEELRDRVEANRIATVAESTEEEQAN